MVKPVRLVSRIPLEALEEDQPHSVVAVEVAADCLEAILRTRLPALDLTQALGLALNRITQEGSLEIIISRLEAYLAQRLLRRLPVEVCSEPATIRRQGLGVIRVQAISLARITIQQQASDLALVLARGLVILERQPSGTILHPAAVFLAEGQIMPPRVLEATRPSKELAQAVFSVALVRTNRPNSHNRIRPGLCLADLELRINKSLLAAYLGRATTRTLQAEAYSVLPTILIPPSSLQEASSEMPPLRIKLGDYLGKIRQTLPTRAEVYSEEIQIAIAEAVVFLALSIPITPAKARGQGCSELPIRRRNLVVYLEAPRPQLILLAASLVVGLGRKTLTLSQTLVACSVPQTIRTSSHRRQIPCLGPTIPSLDLRSNLSSSRRHSNRL